jgi:hypothetical protein
MDATHMFPLGFHPVKDIFLNDVSTPAPIIPRRHAGVKYYFIDYGISSYFPVGESLPHLVVGLAGRDQDVPELSDEVPYDAFKVDIFTVGNVFLREFCDVSFNPVLLKSLPNSCPELFQSPLPPHLDCVHDAA